MINKKNLWFLTLFSLVLVLSVYYITMPSELLLTNNAYVKNVTLPDKGIQNSTRVAFVVQGNVPYAQYRDGVTNEGVTTTGPSLARALKGATNDSVYIWEPNYDAHTASAVTAAYPSAVTTITTSPVFDSTLSSTLDVNVEIVPLTKVELLFAPITCTLKLSLSITIFLSDKSNV